MTTAPTIFYLDTIPGNRIQETTLAGMRRYAVARGWEVEAVSFERSRPDDLLPLLSRRRPAGCIVECCDGRSDLPPRLFGSVPVVYLHGRAGLYGSGAVQLNTDNEAIAGIAYRELSAGRPAAFALVGFRAAFAWSEARERAFAACVRASGKPLFRFRRVGGRADRRDENREARLAKWLSRLPRRTAVFAVNDPTALEVLWAARAARRAIPHDLTLLGVDNDISVCEAFSPSISSIQIDHETAGFLAARALGVSNPQGGNLTTVSPLLVVRRRTTGGSGRRESFVLKAIEMIRAEACNGLSPALLARRFRCSRRLFELRFREATGHSVLDEIQHVRLESVYALLAHTDTAIGAIDELCGWGSPVSLQRFFRSRTGMTMRQWRRKNRR